MIYMTTGFVDEYDNPKVVLEATVTKAFSQDILFRCVQTAIRLVGMQATTSAHPLHQNIQDALKIQNSNESSKALKEYAAFVGLQHSAVNTRKYFIILRKNKFVRVLFKTIASRTISATRWAYMKTHS